MKKQKLNNAITFGGTAVLCIVMSALMSAGALNGNNMLKGLLIPIGIHIILALSLNLTVGILGELSLGHAGFMCVGALCGSAVSQIVMVNTDCPPVPRLVIALAVSGIMAAVFGVLIGIPVLRLRGDYLAIVTLGFGEIVKSLATNIYLTVDANGLHFGFTKPPENVDTETATQILKGPIGVQAPQDTNIWVVTVVLLLVLIVLMTFISSKSGRACMAVRDNYIAAQSVGINVTKFRLMAFTISAGLAGVAGGLYVHSIPMVAFTKFDYNFSILILVFVVLGGLGSLRGSIIATIILYALPEIFREVGDYRMLIYAIVLIGMMIFNNAPFFIQLRERVGASAPVQRLKGIFKKNKTAGGAE
ncbi:MAG: branched-chain amino acid ABC transporter permease [Lachnospiraceae bacterium]|nr:branched-chain amino acid ABC transporter permease [Ruminococcus sp.]MCM1275971.1 branched-chain amino acid ABC transporter permease [Lachnospiraceae bacterium]